MIIHPPTTRKGSTNPPTYTKEMNITELKLKVYCCSITMYILCASLYVCYYVLPMHFVKYFVICTLSCIVLCTFILSTMLYAMEMNITELKLKLYCCTITMYIFCAFLHVCYYVLSHAFY